MPGGQIPGPQPLTLPRGQKSTGAACPPTRPCGAKVGMGKEGRGQMNECGYDDEQTARLQALSVFDPALNYLYAIQPGIGW